MVSVWWDYWDWWTNQPTAVEDNSLNISIVEGLTEKPVSNVSYKLNVLSNSNSVFKTQNEHSRTDIVDLSVQDTSLIEVVFSDIGVATESLKFKFNIDIDSQPLAPFTQLTG